MNLDTVRENKQAYPDKIPEVRHRRIFLASMGLAILWVLFLWGVWRNWVDAYGLNATVYCFVSFFSISYVTEFNNVFKRENCFWFLPLFLLPLSFFLYENPYFKTINIFVYPLLFIFLYNYMLLKDREEHRWNYHFIKNMVFKRINFSFTMIAKDIFIKNVFPVSNESRVIVKKAIIGLLIFFLLAVIVILPLLTSADMAFSHRVNGFIELLIDMVSVEFFMKFVCCTVLCYIFICLILNWMEPFVLDRNVDNKHMDDIISGIVLGGIFVLYMFFVAVQLERLFLDTLPLGFQQTERLVKRGFWQLIFISCMNILFFFIYYKRTGKIVDYILKGFTLVSSIIALSAIERVFMYVAYYGFSYEKFLAAYTVVYCMIVFISLSVFVFLSKRRDIFKYLFVLFLYMYVALMIAPVERIIFHSNVTLSKMSNSRINLYELRILSNDVLPLVKEYKGKQVFVGKAWLSWIKKQEKRADMKAWYEMNLQNIVYENNSTPFQF